MPRKPTSKEVRSIYTLYVEQGHWRMMNRERIIEILNSVRDYFASETNDFLKRDYAPKISKIDERLKEIAA